jgi:hypothetical protein
MLEQYQIIELIKDLNPVIKTGMQGVILEIYDDTNYEVEFVKEAGSNYIYQGKGTFTISTNYFK